ncbi:hypothetical protein [Burkholderia vietnamiensis]|uniref:hypothetical protein n=1 Tax=Burkholderia vietnamiensis TaxID=60552 RepID=UPI0018DC35F7|nr:hypothetical protein [Burkholderia vietnamiensis]MBH9642360.1 hypothetical protein [Burkholderia vietnamiensis]
MRRLLVLVVMAAAMPAVAASSRWVKASSGQDDGSLQTEYVIPSSIKPIRGNYRTAFVRVTYSPVVPASFGTGAIAYTVSETMVDCNSLSWGNKVKIAFDPHDEPVLTEAGEYDTTKPVWTLKNMEKLAPSDITYRTAQFICTARIG